MSILKNYPGAKNNSGIISFLINNIPYHEHYTELFAGSAALARAKKPAKMNLLYDVDHMVIGNLIHSQCFVSSNESTWGIYPTEAKEVLEMSKFNGKGCFMYLDPPYPMQARKSDRPIYRHEMTDSDHVELLTAALELNCNIMISTRRNEIYTDMLKDWRCEKFLTTGRAGMVTELIYMNYEKPEILHQYDHLGHNRTRRQNLKRKRESFLDKINEMDRYERHLLIQEIIANDPAAVKHFLAASDLV